MTRREAMRVLEEEHRHLAPRIEDLRRAADRVGDEPLERLVHIVDDAHELLDAHVLPHAQAEEAALYPAVGRVLGDQRATATMRRDHAAIDELGLELAALRHHVHERRVDHEVIVDLRRVLYGLYQLLVVHFAKEEEVYLPILEAGMTAADEEAIVAAMGHGLRELR